MQPDPGVYALRAGEIILVKLPQNLEIIFHDNHLVVVNKPGGLLAVPGRGPEKQDCLASRLRCQFPEMIRQPAVHRLDMYTSGLMVFAISRQTHRDLSKQFATRRVHKEYMALVENSTKEESGEIRLAFRLDPGNRPLQIYDPEQGKLGITKWRHLQQEKHGSRILFTPLTGRTHQLRVHAAHPLGLNSPIQGDSLYGSGKEGEQMMLHASLLSFHHPETGQELSFTSPPPF